MPIVSDPKQIDEIPLRILQVASARPKKNIRKPKVNITNDGWLQNDNPNLHSIASPSWQMAKSLNSISRRMLALSQINNAKQYILDPSMAPEGAVVEQGPSGGYYYETDAVSSVKLPNEEVNTTASWIGVLNDLYLPGQSEGKIEDDAEKLFGDWTDEQIEMLYTNIDEMQKDGTEGAATAKKIIDTYLNSDARKLKRDFLDFMKQPGSWGKEKKSATDIYNYASELYGEFGESSSEFDIFANNAKEWLDSIGYEVDIDLMVSDIKSEKENSYKMEHILDDTPSCVQSAAYAVENSGSDVDWSEWSEDDLNTIQNYEGAISQYLEYNGGDSYNWYGGIQEALENKGSFSGDPPDFQELYSGTTNAEAFVYENSEELLQLYNDGELESAIKKWFKDIGYSKYSGEDYAQQWGKELGTFLEQMKENPQGATEPEPAEAKIWHQWDGLPLDEKFRGIFSSYEISDQQKAAHLWSYPTSELEDFLANLGPQPEFKPEMITDEDRLAGLVEGALDFNNDAYGYIHNLTDDNEVFSLVESLKVIQEATPSTEETFNKRRRLQNLIAYGTNKLDNKKEEIEGVAGGIPHKIAEHLKMRESEWESGAKKLEAALLGYGKFNVDNQRSFFKKQIMQAIGKDLNEQITPEDVRYIESVGGSRSEYGKTPGEKVASMFVNSWAASSSNSHPLSVALQQLVAKKFGLNDYTRQYSDSGALRKAEDIIERMGGPLDTFIQSSYDHTQDFLEKNGINEVYVARGMKYSYDTLPENLKQTIKKKNFTSPEQLKLFNNLSESYFNGDPDVVKTIANTFSLTDLARLQKESSTNGSLLLEVLTKEKYPKFFTNLAGEVKEKGLDATIDSLDYIELQAMENIGYNQTIPEVQNILSSLSQPWQEPDGTKADPTQVQTVIDHLQTFDYDASTFLYYGNLSDGSPVPVDVLDALETYYSTEADADPNNHKARQNARYAAQGIERKKADWAYTHDGAAILKAAAYKRRSEIQNGANMSSTDKALSLAEEFTTSGGGNFNDFVKNKMKDLDSASVLSMANNKATLSDSQSWFTDQYVDALQDAAQDEALKRALPYSYRPQVTSPHVRAQLQHNPISSFSTNIDTAQSFGSGSEYNLLMFAKIPAKNVFSTFRTGFGCSNEYEVVGMGNIPDPVHATLSSNGLYDQPKTFAENEEIFKRATAIMDNMVDLPPDLEVPNVIGPKKLFLHSSQGFADDIDTPAGNDAIKDIAAKLAAKYADPAWQKQIAEENGDLPFMAGNELPPIDSPGWKQLIENEPMPDIADKLSAKFGIPKHKLKIDEDGFPWYKNDFNLWEKIK